MVYSRARSVCAAGPMNKTFQRDTRETWGRWLWSITEKHKSCWLTSTRPRRSSKTRSLLYKYCKSHKCWMKPLMMRLWAAAATKKKPYSHLFFVSAGEKNCSWLCNTLCYNVIYLVTCLPTFSPTCPVCIQAGGDRGKVEKQRKPTRGPAYHRRAQRDGHRERGARQEAGRE